MNGGAKRTAFLLLALALTLGPAPSAARDPDGVAALEGVSMGLASFVRDEWCGLDRPARAARWAGFHGELARLFRLPAVTEGALLEFFRSELGPDVVERSFVMVEYMGRLLTNVKRLPPERLPFGLSEEAERSSADSMSTESARWAILLAAKYGDDGSSDDREYVRWEENFRRDFSASDGRRGSAVCGEALTRAIDGVHPFRLGAAALFVDLTSFFLRPPRSVGGVADKEALRF